MSDPSSKMSRRLADRFASPYVAGLAAHLTRVQDSILDLHGRLDWIEAELREVPKREERIKARIDEIAAIAASDAALQRETLRAIYEKADEQRLRLYELRRSEAYEAAFTETEPLVSFVIPTYDRFELLRDRSLPSILGQSYKNLEVIVSGDDSPADTEQVVRDLDDPRLRFINRTVRGPYPDDPQERWLMSGTPPLNDGVAAARGRWIAILGDDDEVTPEHTTSLVRAAQEQRIEHCYGRMKIRFSDGGELDWESKFPPAYGYFTLQLSIYHAGLRFFQYEPIDVLMDVANDWSLARRMVAAGVRFGKIDQLVAYKYERRLTPPVASETTNTPQPERGDDEV
jgi:hypothetical protein